MNANRFTQKSLEAIQSAQQLAETNRNTQLEQIHLLKTLTDEADDLNAQLLASMQVDMRAFSSAIDRALAALPTYSGDGQQTYAAPILRYKGQGGVQTLAGAVEGDLFPVQLHGAARLIEAHDPVRDAELALTGQTANAENFTFLNVEGDVTDRFTGHIHPEVADGHHGFQIRGVSYINAGRVFH